MPRRASARLVLAIAAAVAALLSGCSANGPGEGSGSTAQATGALARTADSFVDSVGVNTHTYYDDTVYAQRFAAIEERLAELGVRHVRENLVTGRPDQYRHLNELAGAGIGSTLILGDPGDGVAGIEWLTSILGSDLRSSVDAVEGANEFDLSGDPDWERRVDAYQADLYAAIESDSRLSSLPVIGPSLGRAGDQARATDVSPYLDYGNIHPYPNAEPPETDIAEWLAAARRMSGPKPVMATETGYHTALAASSGQRPVSEAAMATYMPRLFLEYFRQGIVRTFAYELADEFPDPARAEPESNFGLLRNDLTPKPAFTALRNLIEILEDPGPPFAPGRLEYSLSGDRTQLHRLLLEKRDGRFYLALWRASSVWDADARAPLDPGSAPVELKLGSEPRLLRLYAPNVSAAPVGLPRTGGGPISVEVGPRVTIVEVQPG